MSICSKCGEQMDESDGIYYVVSKIREALGVGGKPGLMELPGIVQQVVDQRNGYQKALRFAAQDMGRSISIHDPAACPSDHGWPCPSAGRKLKPLQCPLGGGITEEDVYVCYESRWLDLAAGEPVTIHPTKQTKLHTNEQNGNCFRACLATITGLGIDDMPHFEDMSADEWWPKFFKWAWDNGWEVFSHSNAPDGVAIATGYTKRNTYHAVVVDSGRMVHDPHPSNDGLKKQDWWCTLESTSRLGA